MPHLTKAAAILGLTLAHVATAQSHARAAAVDSLMADYARPSAPGASVLVVPNGRVDLIRSHGRADVERATPVQRETNFRLASLTKQFTATAVMQLAADGKLRFDDEIGAILPTLPEFARRVTIRQLLNHTGGLPDYEDFVPDTQTAQVAASTPRLSILRSGIARCSSTHSSARRHNAWRGLPACSQTATKPPMDSSGSSSAIAA